MQQPKKTLAEFDAAVLAHVAKTGEWPRVKESEEWAVWQRWMGRNKLSFTRRCFELGRPRYRGERKVGKRGGARTKPAFSTFAEVEAMVVAYRERTGLWPSVESGRAWKSVNHWLRKHHGTTLAVWRAERFGATTKVVVSTRRPPPCRHIEPAPKSGPDLTSWRATMGPLGGKRAV